MEVQWVGIHGLLRRITVIVTITTLRVPRSAADKHAEMRESGRGFSALDPGSPPAKSGAKTPGLSCARLGVSMNGASLWLVVL